MNIGYACLTVGVPHTDQRSCTLKYANQEKLLELISHNLSSLENIIDYNIKNNIRLFRISSDLVPFGSSPANDLEWWNIFDSQLSRVGHKISNNGIRVSMHPGQYTVLNSQRREVVEKAIEDLRYHTRVLDSLGVGDEHKIVLHIGGFYNDKSSSKERFMRNYHELDDAVKRRLVIENDDKSYNISDVLEIGHIINVPVVFDNLHHHVNPCAESRDDYYWISRCQETWKNKDGLQKIHYSQQDPLKKPGSHSSSIQIDEFMSFYDGLIRDDIDIMLEVKDKNLSAVKCINCTSSAKSIGTLEVEWSRYKYKVLENSPADYLAIRQLLKNKADYPVIKFYYLIENAMKEENTVGNSINAALHVWGYFKDQATDRETSIFLNNVKKYGQGETSLKTLKNDLWKMTVKYNQPYLLKSYYFI